MPVIRTLVSSAEWFNPFSGVALRPARTSLSPVSGHPMHFITRILMLQHYCSLKMLFRRVLCRKEASIRRGIALNRVPVPSGERSEGETAPAGRVRIVWLDVAKGLGILIVVLGHVFGGIMDMPGHQAPMLFRQIFLALYVFHMPLFFFLAGLLVLPRLERSRTGFLIDMALTVAWPYFLWSAIQYSVIFAAGSMVNRPVKQFWAPILNLPWSSISQFWFLYVLFILHLAALIVIPRLGVRVFFLVALAAKLIVPLLTVPVMLRLSMVHGIFYALGVLAGTGGTERLRQWVLRDRWRGPALMLTGCVAIIVATTAIIADQQPLFYSLPAYQIAPIAWRLPVAPAAMAAMLGVFALVFICAAAPARVLSFLGRRSMAMFVLHVLFIAGTRILLVKLGYAQPLLLLAACATAGIAGPLLVHATVKRFSNSRIWGLG